MAKVGYIFNSSHCDGLDEDRQWMQQYGCCDIVEEQESQEALRPMWKQMLSSLKLGDELVVSKLSNAVRGSRELAVFLEYCRIKTIRLISIRDRIDSRNELFPETRNSDILNMIALLPAEVSALRNASTHTRRLKKRLKSTTPKGNEKLERNKRVINMYKSNYTIEEIWKASGFHSRSSVFRVLNDAGIKLRNKKSAQPK
jgi:DNA invertase Pin-like site-specific DNA recombinase